VVRSRATNVWRRVGHLVETAIAYPELTVRENLEVARRLYAVAETRVVDQVIERLGLTTYANRRAGVLSLGNLQRLALARALLHAPRLLVLDEPTNGLDPAGVIEVRELLRVLAQDHGVTVFMSSHILAEVDRLATRVGIVHRGRLIEELDTEALERHRDQRLEVGARRLDLAEQVLAASGFASRRRATEGSNCVLELREQRALDAPEEVVQLLVEAGAHPTRLAVTHETLEDHFMRVTRSADGIAR